jgi:HSP20 family protein
MDYIKLQFGHGMGEFHNRLGRTIEQVFRTLNPVFDTGHSQWKPQMDIHETATEIVVIGEIAGVALEDLVVELDTRALKISGKRAETPREPGAKFHLVEIQYGPFERILFLPAPVNPEKVSATCVNGLLHIRMVKRAPEGPLRVSVEEQP